MSDDNKKETAVTVVETNKPDPVEKKKFKPLRDDPYDYQSCVISAILSWTPNDGDPMGRQFVIAVRNHQDTVFNSIENYRIN